jgi:hypothetical protein
MHNNDCNNDTKANGDTAYSDTHPVTVDAPFAGEFMPIRQWFYYDAVEALDDTPLPAEEVAPRGCRYDGQIMVFGRSIQVSTYAVGC